MKVMLLAVCMLGYALAMPVGVDESDNPRPVVPLVITDYSSVASKAAEATAAPVSETSPIIPDTVAKVDDEPQSTAAAPTELTPPASDNDAIRSVEIPTSDLQETAKVADYVEAVVPREAEAAAPAVEASESKPEEIKETLKAATLAADATTVPQGNKDTATQQDTVLEKQVQEKTEATNDAPTEEKQPIEAPTKTEEKEVKTADNIELSPDTTKPTEAPGEKMDKATQTEEKIKEDSSSEESKESTSNAPLAAEVQPKEPQQEKKIEAADENKEATADNKGKTETKPEDKSASRRRRHVKEDNKPVEENKKPTSAPKKEKEEKKGKSDGALDDEVKTTESSSVEKTELTEKIIPAPTVAQDTSADEIQKDIKDKLNSEEKAVSDDADKQAMEDTKIENKREAVATEEKKDKDEEKVIPTKPEVKHDEKEKATQKSESPQEPPKEEGIAISQPTAISDKSTSEESQKNTATEKKTESVEKSPEVSVEKEDSPIAGTSHSASEEKNMELRADSKSDESS